ncbi:MAG: cytochrome c1 [Gemmataceae bacterium]|nr:cytochrome c1 [Gemmataceae bacterium]
MTFRLSRSTFIISLVASLTIAAPPALAGGEKKPMAPAVPGFARFYQNDQAKAAEGGHLLMGALNCMQCHLPKQPELVIDFRPAPILDTVATRVKTSYLREFLSDPQKAKPGTTMPNLFASLEADDKKAKVEALTHLLASTGLPQQMRPDGKGIVSGRDLYSKVGCVACHGTRNAKGDQDKLFATSVPLGNLKAKYHLAGLKAFLENPHQTRPLGRMPGILIGKEASDVAKYLLHGSTPGVSAHNMKYSYYEGAWKNLPDFAKLKPIATGEASDFDLGAARRTNNCALRFEGYLDIEKDGTYSFHVTSDDGSRLWIDDKLVVNNDGVHPPQLKSGNSKLTKGVHKIVVAVFNGGGGFELGVEFEGPGAGRQPLGPRILLSSEPAKVGVEPIGDEPLTPNAQLLAKGKELFGSMGCANCHQLPNEKKSLNATAFDALKGEGGCLDAAPKKGIPWYGLSTTQQTALRAAIQKPAAAITEPKDVIAFTMKHQNCYGCHERDKIGGVEIDVNPHFQATFKEWGDEARIPPSLTGAGAKLNAAYLKKILEQGSHDRPYMHTRMPRFGASAAILVALLDKADAAETNPKVAFADPLTKVKAAGRHMVGKQAFNCINCHNFGGVKTDGVQGIDMAIMAERVKKEWFHNYLINPTKYRAGTRMPSSFPDGTTLLKNVLDGKADTQIEAIWLYLADGKNAMLPVGLNKSSIPLIPINEAIIYRNFIQGAGTRAIGVGFPERAHLAFDANDIRLAMIWQGGFMDAKRHWTGRGEGAEAPMGDNILNLPAGVTFFVLAKDDEAWPTQKAKELGYKFKGYRLTDDQRPTFLYSFNEIKIEDTPNAFEAKGNPMIRRTFAISTDNPIDNLYYRAIVANQIDPEAQGGWYRINDTWRMRIEANAPPVIRKSAGKMELLVPIRFKGNDAKIVQEYQW